LIELYANCRLKPPALSCIGAIHCADWRASYQTWQVSENLTGLNTSTPNPG